MPEPMHSGASIAVFHGAKAVFITTASSTAPTFGQLIHINSKLPAGSHISSKGIRGSILCGAMRRLRLGSQSGFFSRDGTKEVGRAANQRDELASPHSITSSARASSVGGIVRPSAFAVLRLMTDSNLVGNSTGNSAARMEAAWLVSIGGEHSQDGQRNVEFVHDSRGLISQSNITMKLIGKATDEACSKTAPRRLLDRRAALLGPRQLEQLRFFIDRRRDVDAPRRVGQRTVLDRIRA